MAIALVANTSKSGFGTSPSINTTGANLLIVLVGWTTASADPTVSDSKGNSWTCVSAVEGTGTASLYYAENPTVGSGHTFSTTVGASSHCVAAFSGASVTTFTLDRAVDSVIASAKTLQPGSLTPPINNCLMIAGLAYRDTTTVSVNSGFTITNQVAFVSGTAVGSVLSYLVQTTATAENPTFSWTNNSLATSIMATFR